MSSEGSEWGDQQIRGLVEKRLCVWWKLSFVWGAWGDPSDVHVYVRERDKVWIPCPFTCHILPQPYRAVEESEKKNGVTKNKHARRGRKISVFAHGMPVFFAGKADSECCLWSILLELFDFYGLFFSGKVDAGRDRAFPLFKRLSCQACDPLSSLPTRAPGNIDSLWNSRTCRNVDTLLLVFFSLILSVIYEYAKELVDGWMAGCLF